MLTSTLVLAGSADRSRSIRCHWQLAISLSRRGLIQSPPRSKSGGPGGSASAGRARRPSRSKIRPSGRQGGSAPGVGVVGYTTGGGLGPVSRTFGWASDRVRAIELVTGDGVLRRVTAHDDPDLFWAVRGGKGALGIVTALEFDLIRQPTLYAGALYFDGADAATVVHAWRDWCAKLPREATTSIALLQLPALPGIPEPLAGRFSVAVRFAWTGAAADGEAALAPMRDVAKPVIDAVQTIPYAAITKGASVMTRTPSGPALRRGWTRAPSGGEAARHTRE